MRFTANGAPFSGRIFTRCSGTLFQCGTLRDTQAD